jgi:hypothetical protein
MPQQPQQPPPPIPMQQPPMLDAPPPQTISVQAVFHRCRELSDEVLMAQSASLHWQEQAQRLAQQVRDLQATNQALVTKLNEAEEEADNTCHAMEI